MCGNFGLLATPGTDEKSILEVLRKMATLTELRGALGGGLATISWDYAATAAKESSGWSVISKRVRILQGKRQILTNELLKANARTRPRIVPGPRTTVAYLGHTRYPTSSRSMVPELHPHCWTPHGPLPSSASDTTLWFCSTTRPEPEKTDTNSSRELPQMLGLGVPTIKGTSASKAGLFVSHNGDYDEYELFGQRVTCTAMGKWLARVLHQPNLSNLE